MRAKVWVEERDACNSIRGIVWRRGTPKSNIAEVWPDNQHKCVKDKLTDSRLPCTFRAASLAAVAEIAPSISDWCRRLRATS